MPNTFAAQAREILKWVGYDDNRFNKEQALNDLIKFHQAALQQAETALLDRVEKEMIPLHTNELDIRRNLTHDQSWHRLDAINEHINEQRKTLSALRSEQQAGTSKP